MYASHSLGKAFVAEAVAVETTVSNKAIGYFLYGTTITNGIGLSYVWDDAVHVLWGKESKAHTEADFVRDFVIEFIHVDVPVALEFIIEYMQEIAE